MKPAENETKAPCQRCGQNIAFPLDIAGQDIQCPHCGRETTLPKIPSLSELIVPDIEHAPKPLRPVIVGIGALLHLICYAAGAVFLIFLLFLLIRWAHMAWGTLN